MNLPIRIAAAFAVGTGSLLAQGALTTPCREASLGTNLQLGDDDVATGMPLGFVFPGPGGIGVTSIGISSNGFVWLDSSLDPGCCNAYDGKFLARGPRIAPLWMDLDPSSGGAVWFQTFAAGGGAPARAVITWDHVPEMGAGGEVTVQLQMFADGSVLVFFGPDTTIEQHSALTGITAGNGAVPNMIDMLATQSMPHDSGALPSAYDMHFGNFDMPGTAWTFVPNGQGGYVVAPKAGCPIATVRTFGFGCPRPATFFQYFPMLGANLANTAFEFFPQPSGGYQVVQLPGFFAGYSAPLSLGDDATTAALALPFVFSYPGGSTSAIEVASNGFVWLQSGGGESRCCNGDPGAFVVDPASIAVWWQDLDPTAATSGGIYFDVVGTTEAHVTWVDVPEFFSLGLNTCQLTLRSDNSFRLSWGNVTNDSHDVLVGFSQGGGRVIPPQVDFTSGTFATPGFGTPLELRAATGSHPAIGTTFTMAIEQIAAGSPLGVMVFGATGFPTGIDLTPIGMDGCSLYAALDAVGSFVPVGTTASYGFVLPMSAPLLGATLAVQAATVSPGATPLGLLSSNGLELIVGY